MQSGTIVKFLPLVAMACMWSFNTMAQCTTKAVQQLMATGGVPPGGLFGFELDIWEDTLIVGAETDSEIAQSSGAAYIFRRTPAGTFVQTQKLAPLDGESGSNFGHAVAIWGDTVVVGARGDNDFVGSAYVYRRTASGTWVQHQKLEPIDAGQVHEYGFAVDIFDRTIIIGSLGSAHVYRRSHSGVWVLEDILLGSDGGLGNIFGVRVAAGWNNVLVSVSGHDNKNGTNAGAVYAFRRQPGATWQETQIVIAPDGHDHQAFGYDICIEGNRALISALFDGELMEGAGAAYYFRRPPGGQWVFQQKIRAFDAAVDDYFGFGVAMSGELAVVGAHGDDDMGQSAGSAYLFRRSGRDHWAPAGKMLAPDGQPYDLFGSVLIQHNQVIVGAGFDDNDDGLSTGSAWVFDVVCDLIGDVNGDGVVDIDDVLMVISGWGDCDKGAPCPADVNGDGVVDIHDLLAVLSGWG